MNRIRLAIVGVVLVALASVGLAQSSPLEQTLIDTQRAAANAVINKDAAFFARMLADGYVEVDANGETSDREDVIKGVADSDITNILLYNFKLIPLDDAAAVLTYDRVLLRKKRDFGSRRYQHVSSAWVKDGGQWKLKFQQITPNQWSANDID
ncbi:MAG TPA: nuclear transport factor 2 family protein [Terriglobales bacterium]|nr:nuclear transport factor 2 family protein [Terriglobales bacterium]